MIYDVGPKRPLTKAQSVMWQEAAQKAAKDLLTEGDSRVMDAADVLSAEIDGLSLNGALEVLMAIGVLALKESKGK